MSAYRVMLVVAVLLAACGGRGEPPDSDRAAAGSDSTGRNRIELTVEQVTNAGIEVATAEDRPVEEVLEATAEIEPAPAGMAQVGARVAGRVTGLGASEGDHVAAGEILAQIDSPELGQVTGEYLSAVSLAEVAREIADRERVLFERKISAEREWRLAEAEAVRTRAAKESAENRLHAMGLTDEDLRQLQVAGHFSSDLAVRTPLAGVISKRTAAIGRIVQPGEGLFEIVALGEVAIAIDIYEQALERVRPGQRVEVRTTATGARVFRGTVLSVGAVVERETRTAKVRVLLPNPGHVLRPGMFATVRVLGASAEGVAARGVHIAVGAVQHDGGEAIVFVESAVPRAYERRVVQLGREANGEVVVLRGLRAGERVVIRGALALRSEFRKGSLGEPE